MATNVDGALVLLLLLIESLVVTVGTVTAFVFIIWTKIRGVICNNYVAYDEPWPPSFSFIMSPNLSVSLLNRGMSRTTVFTRVWAVRSTHRTKVVEQSVLWVGRVQSWYTC